MKNSTEHVDVNDLIEMINALARLDFSKRVKTNFSNDSMDVLGYGLNMLSEELEYKVNEKKRLEEVNENLERFSYTVAHDLKSPILASSGLIDFMQDEIADNGQIPTAALKEYLDILKAANAQVSKFIDGILQYSRIENNKMRMSKINLSDFCWEVGKHYRANDKAEIIFSNNLPNVYHNEIALGQVLHNLISNAIKYCDKELCKIYIEHQEDTFFHQISITDNGPGVKDAEKKIIFNLFENLRNTARESTGVGLAIVEKIVSKSGGKVWVEDASPSGAKFIFTIPKEIA